MVGDGEGTPQGASASPLLSNVYLHYVFDLWADQWRRRHAQGDVIILRFADDYIVGFEHQEDAQRFLAELHGRLAKFSLELAAEKTRLIEFGRFAAERRQKRGLGKPETFQFLGFTHICAKTGPAVHAQADHRLEAVAGEAARGQGRVHGDAGTCRSPNRADGSAAWFEDTSTTTPCPATSRRSKPSATRRPGTGTRRFGAAASALA